MDLATFLSLLLGLITLVPAFFSVTGWVKRLCGVVSVIALVEFALLLAPMPTLARVVIGIVLLAIGIAWMLIARRNERATDPQHTKQIHDVLDQVKVALDAGSPSNLGVAGAAVIRCHFPAIAQTVSEWDAVVDRVTAAKRRLRENVEDELKKLDSGESPYNFDSIRDGLYAITEARTGVPSALGQLPPMVGPDTDDPVFRFVHVESSRIALLKFNEAAGATGEVAHFEGDSYPDGAVSGLDQRYGKPVYELLVAMQGWNSAKLLAMKRGELQAIAKAGLDAVKHERRKARYRRVQACCPRLPKQAATQA